jgi:signal transduction histidine kinase
VSVSVSPEIPDLFVDPALAVEILSNLIENAARVTPPGAPIELKAEPDPLDPARVRLSIRDRGPGVPANVKRAAGGHGEASDSGRSGLGLEICRSLARALGGSVVLADRPGGGTTARVDRRRKSVGAE